jgi:hypothetical protein
MSSKRPQRAVYLVTAAIVASMVAGFALAQLSLGQNNTSYQGSQTTTVSPLNGLKWDFTALTVVNASTQWAVPCGSSAVLACDVTTVSKAVCAGGFTGLACGQGDFIEEVNLTTEAAKNFTGGTTYPVVVSLTVYVTGTPIGGTFGTYAGSPFYFKETATNTAAYIALDFDIGTSEPAVAIGSVTSVSVIAVT